MANHSIYSAFERMWQYVVAAIGGKANLEHTHDDIYYTETEIDTKLLNKADASSIPSKTSELTNDSGYLTDADVDDVLAQAKESGEFDGEDGYTPVRGTDYWTEEDKAEIKSYVDEAILGGTW